MIGYFIFVKQMTEQLLTFTPELHDMINHIVKTTLIKGDNMFIVARVDSSNVGKIQLLTINNFEVSVPQTVLINEDELIKHHYTYTVIDDEYVISIKVH